jgi:hypothetical protein
MHVMCALHAMHVGPCRQVWLWQVQDLVQGRQVQWQQPVLSIRLPQGIKSACWLGLLPLPLLLLPLLWLLLMLLPLLLPLLLMLLLPLVGWRLLLVGWRRPLLPGPSLGLCLRCLCVFS